MEDTLVSDLCTPVFVVDLQKVKQNAQAMLERFQQMGVQLRPHMKTHKTVECGEIMTGGSRRCIAVSTLAEAAFYAEHGFDDILYAYPLPLDKVERCAQLSEELVLFHVLIDSRVALQQLRTRPLKGGRVWRVWLKLDCDNGRAGVPHSEPAALLLAQDIFQSEGVELTGIYVHCGNTYSCSGEEHIKAIAQKTTTFILHFMEKLELGIGNVVIHELSVPVQYAGKPFSNIRMKAAGMDGPKSSIGSTPSCSHPVQDMAQLSEVHPGNYVFYDAQQMKIGSCKLEQVAVRVLTRVIGHYPSRNQLLVDCGWAALSHDGGGCLPTGYAIIEGHPNLRLLSMTQEHGRVEPISGNLDYKKFPIGAMLCLIPYHACATAMMHAIFFVHSEGKVVDKWTPTRGW